jgi:hypothetical protein
VRSTGKGTHLVWRKAVHEKQRVARGPFCDLISLQSFIAMMSLASRPLFRRLFPSRGQSNIASALPSPSKRTIEEVRRERGGHALGQNSSSTPLTSNVLIAVDPDTKGAIAVATWTSYSMSAPMHDGAGNGLEVVDWKSVEFRVFDMPCASVQLAKKSKVTGKPAMRRIIDVQAAKKLILQECSSTNTGLSASQPNQFRLLAYVEAPPIIPSDSALSTSTMSYTNGVWHGLFAMGGFRTGSVPARIWKRDLDLCKKDKEASRLLASRVFPSMQDLFSLKKNHGRAEALLIAAWALGLKVERESSLGSFVFGPLQTCHQTDAYGNDVVCNNVGHVSASINGSTSVYADVETLQQLKLEEKQERSNAKIHLAALQKEARRLRKIEIAQSKVI